MTEEKTYKATTVAGLYSGVLLELGGFDRLHECAEWVLGYPVWTHEFATKWTRDHITKTLETVFPEIREVNELAAGVDVDNVLEVATKISERWPRGIPIPRGDCKRPEPPLESLENLLVDVENKKTS